MTTIETPEIKATIPEGIAYVLAGGLLVLAGFAAAVVVMRPEIAIAAAKEGAKLAVKAAPLVVA